MSFLTNLFCKKKSVPATINVVGTAPAVQMVLVDFGGTGVDKSKLPAIALAVAKQTQVDFGAPPPVGYGISCSIRVATSPTDVKSNEWVIGLFATADQPGALGYHDRGPNGQPVMKIFPLLDPANLSVTISHEVLECLADPEINIIIQGNDGKLWACEACDAVEADSYSIDGIPVSNFVTLAWYGGLTGVKYDHLGLCSSPFQVRKGGYAQYLDPSKGWQQIQNFSQAPRAYRQQIQGRRARRAAR